MSNTAPVSQIKTQPLLSSLVPSITAENGQAVTSSIKVAEYFDKRHADVLRAIKNLGCSNEYRERNFALTFVDVLGPNNSSRKSSVFQMTKNGFVMLVMGFTGKLAAQFKESYINAFDDMEANLRKPKELPTSDTTLEKLLLDIPEGRYVDLPPKLIKAMEYRTMTMAIETKDAIEEYLRRLISYTCVNGHGELDADKAFKRVSEAKLESALLHKKMYLLNAYKGFASMLKNYGDQLCTEVNQYK